MRVRLLSSLMALVVFLGSHVFAAAPPGQPEKGPGSPSAALIVTKKALGEHGAVTFAFYAATNDKGPKPVVVFFHPWGGPEPQLYGGWIEHLARRGYLVLFPRYQEIGWTPGSGASERAATLIKTALETLKDDPIARPDLNRVAYIGHLAGAIVAMDLAAQPNGLPSPKLVQAVMPGGIASEKEKDSSGIPLADLTAIPPGTMLIVMSGDRSNTATDRVARRLLYESTGIPLQNKLFMRVSSDTHGYPVLSATLAAPGAPLAEYSVAEIGLPAEPVVEPVGKQGKRKRPPAPKRPAGATVSGEQSMLVSQIKTNVVDALDYRAFWKTFDMASAAAFAGHEAASLKETSAFIDMGVWSDGFPVKRLSAEMPRPAEGEAPAASSR